MPAIFLYASKAGDGQDAQTDPVELTETLVMAPTDSLLFTTQLTVIDRSTLRAVGVILPSRTKFSPLLIFCLTHIVLATQGA